MAAGQGFKTFTTGEVLTAGDVNGYLMQGINVFTNSTARDAAITAPAEGQFAFTKDNNSLWYYDGAAWVASGATGDIEGVTAGVGISGGGTSGTVTVTNSMATAIDAKGDLVPGTGADTFARLAVGANGTVLTADSAEATGLKWATVAGGSYTQLATGSLSGATTTISSISSSYKDLRLVLNNVSISGNDEITLQINGYTSGYNWLGFRAGDSSFNGFAMSGNQIKIPSGNTLASDTSYRAVIDFPNYSVSGPVFCNFNGVVNSNTATTGLQVFLGTGSNTTSAVISSITLKANWGGAYVFDSGTYTLFGVN